MSTISIVTKLQKQVNALEEKIQKLQSKSKDMISDIGFTVFTKNFLNLNITNAKKFRIRTITNSKSSQFYQLKIKFYNFVKQSTSFSLFSDNIRITSDTQTFEQGTNEIILYGTYENLISDKIVIELQVIPKDNKQITITNTTLTIWGNTQEKSEEYQAVETNDSYFLSYISNNRMYYKTFSKSTPPDEVEFEFFESAISHATCVQSNTIYLFRVDEDNNLFYSAYPDFDETILAQNVGTVSCCNANDVIVFCYISNGVCHYGEIKNKIVISNKILELPFNDITDCYLYYSKNKCYLIITKSSNSNYLLESVSNIFCNFENIKANVALKIETSEEE